MFTSLFFPFILMVKFQWTSICTTTGMEGFYIAVRGTVEDHAEPKIFFSPKAEKFIRAVLDVEPRRLALRLESWVVSGIGKSFNYIVYYFTQQLILTILDAPATTNRQYSLNKVISDCRTIIQEELSKQKAQ